MMLVFITLFLSVIIAIIPFSMSKYSIAIGNKAYSSWSLRGWLAIRAAAGKEGFEENVCFLAGAGATAERTIEAQNRILTFSPTGKVPALHDHDLGVVVYDSLAICLHVADRFPDANLLPKLPALRARCFSAVAEMHSGFTALRTHMPHNCVSTARRHGSTALLRSDVQADIQRLCDLWSELRSLPSIAEMGPYLFGNFTIADCFYGPVALRFNTYDPDLNSLASNPLAQDYVRALIQNEMIQEWIASARLEGPETKIPQYEQFAD
jgi:glutathione S-transferase